MNALIVLGVALVVSLPLFLTLWADPTLQQRVDQLAGPLEALQAGDPQPILQSVVNTLGVFSFTGDPRWTYTLPDRPVFDWGTAVFFYAGLLFALWRWRQPIWASRLSPGMIRTLRRRPAMRRRPLPRHAPAAAGVPVPAVRRGAEEGRRALRPRLTVRIAERGSLPLRLDRNTRSASSLSAPAACCRRAGNATEPGLVSS